MLTHPPKGLLRLRPQSISKSPSKEKNASTVGSRSPRRAAVNGDDDAGEKATGSLRLVFLYAAAAATAAAIRSERGGTVWRIGRSAPFRRCVVDR